MLLGVPKPCNVHVDIAVYQGRKQGGRVARIGLRAVYLCARSKRSKWTPNTSHRAVTDKSTFIKALSNSRIS